MNAKTIGVTISLLSIFFIWNPTGYSYMNYAINFAWALDPLSMLFGLLGAVLVSISLFYIYNAYRSTEILGKVMFLLITAFIVGLLYTMDMLTNIHNIGYTSILAVMLFVIWGMTYPRLKYALFRTHHVDDADTDNDDE